MYIHGLSWFLLGCTNDASSLHLHTWHRAKSFFWNQPWRFHLFFFAILSGTWPSYFTNVDGCESLRICIKKQSHILWCGMVWWIINSNSEWSTESIVSPPKKLKPYADYADSAVQRHNIHMPNVQMFSPFSEHGLIWSRKETLSRGPREKNHCVAV